MGGPDPRTPPPPGPPPGFLKMILFLLVFVLNKILFNRKIKIGNLEISKSSTNREESQGMFCKECKNTPMIFSVLREAQHLTELKFELEKKIKEIAGK